MKKRKWSNLLGVLIKPWQGLNGNFISSLDSFLIKRKTLSVMKINKKKGRSEQYEHHHHHHVSYPRSLGFSSVSAREKNVTTTSMRNVLIAANCYEFLMGTRIISCYARHSHLSGRSDLSKMNMHQHHVSYLRLLGVSSVHTSRATFLRVRGRLGVRVFCTEHAL